MAIIPVSIVLAGHAAGELHLPFGVLFILLPDRVQEILFASFVLLGFKFVFAKLLDYFIALLVFFTVI